MTFKSIKQKSIKMKNKKTLASHALWLGKSVEFQCMKESKKIPRKEKGQCTLLTNKIELNCCKDKKIKIEPIQSTCSVYEIVVYFTKAWKKKERKNNMVCVMSLNLVEGNLWGKWRRRGSKG